MMPVILAIALITIAGAACVRLIDRHAPEGLWYLYGCGALTLILQWLPWTRATLAVIAAAAVAALVWSRRAGVARSRIRLSPLDALTAAVLALFTTFVSISPLWEWDAWAIWAMKGRTFFESRGVDWAFLESPFNSYAHPDYPLLVPVNLALPSILAGSWDDRWLALMQVALLVSGVLAIRAVTARRFTPLISASIALVLAALGASRYAGTAETPMIVFAVTAIVFLHAGEWRHAAILLGLAAMTKNEGLSLILAAAIALLLTGRAKQIHKLWPAAALTAPWMIARALHDLPTDVFSGSLLARAASRLGQAGDIIPWLAENSERHVLWIVAFCAAIFAARRAAVPLLTTLAQAVACIAIYFVTPHDVFWHIGTSWDRVSLQLLAMLAISALLGLAEILSAPSATQSDSPRPLQSPLPATQDQVDPE